LEGKASELQGRTGLALFLHGFKVGFAHLKTLINPAKSRVLLFDERQSLCFSAPSSRAATQKKSPANRAGDF
jgi:hypothetical protein